eukprot:bmy_00057T0
MHCAASISTSPDITSSPPRLLHHRPCSDITVYSAPFSTPAALGLSPPRVGRVTCRRRAPPGAGREVRRRRPERGEPGRPSLYFGGSIPGGREDRELYGRIVSRLRRFGAELTEHVATADQGARSRVRLGLLFLPSGCVEVAQPSLGVGYELGRAVARNKPVLCLFRPQSGRVLSATIRGAAEGSRVQVWGYEAEEVAACWMGTLRLILPSGWLLP